jgi:uncharacterized protein YbcI
MNTSTQALEGHCDLDIDYPDSVTDQIAQAVWDFEVKIAGRNPRAVSVVLNRDILVIKRHRSFTSADRIVGDMIAKLHESLSHRVLVETDTLWHDIERITGKQLTECTADLGPQAAAAIRKAILSGILMQVFRLS